MNYIVTLLFFTLLLSAQTKSESPQPYFSAIIVSDINASMSWYESHFGFEKVNLIENEARGFKMGNMKNDGAWIEFIELASTLMPNDIIKDKPRGTRIGGYFKFGFTVQDLDAWVAKLKKANVTFRGDVVTDPLSKMRMIIVLDPDGNRVQLFEKK